MTQVQRKTESSVHDQFTARWSPRAFKDTALTDADLQPLFEAARWAPSASNNQPWRFAYGLRGDEGFAKIAAGLVPFNRGWAEKAAALVVVASRSTVIRPEQGEVPNPLSPPSGCAFHPRCPHANARCSAERTIR